MSDAAMAGPADEQFFARLCALNESFASGVPAMLERLAATRAAFNPAAPDAAQLGAAQALLHTMAGSGVTFGFRVLGQQARALEQRLRVLMAFDAVAEGEWEAWFDDVGAFVAWGLRDPRAAYYGDSPAQ